MSPETRAAVAAITLAHASGRKISSIYDYSGDGHRNLSASVTADQVNAYDYTSGCHISGRLSSVYHYGKGGHIEIKDKGNGKYGGYDYSSSSYFDVTISGKNVSLYDYGSSAYFNFSG